MVEGSEKATVIGLDRTRLTAVQTPFPDLHKRSGVVTVGQTVLPPTCKLLEAPQENKEGRGNGTIHDPPHAHEGHRDSTGGTPRVRGEGATEMDPPPLPFAAPLSSATSEDNEAPSMKQMALKYLNEDEARQTKWVLRKYETM